MIRTQAFVLIDEKVQCQETEIEYGRRQERVGVHTWVH